MKIRKAAKQDIPKIALLEKSAYGEKGYSEQFLLDKYATFPDGVMVAENANHLTGYILYEALGKDEMSGDFRIVKLEKPISSRWMHIIAFTTETNYKDFEHDSELLHAAEKAALNNKCLDAYVPLPKQHTFDAHGAHQFWERNGYRKIGTILWLPESGNPIECLFYKKALAD